MIRRVPLQDQNGTPLDLTTILLRTQSLEIQIDGIEEQASSKEIVNVSESWQLASIDEQLTELMTLLGREQQVSCESRKAP